MFSGATDPWLVLLSVPAPGLSKASDGGSVTSAPGKFRLMDADAAHSVAKACSLAFCGQGGGEASAGALPLGHW